MEEKPQNKDEQIENRKMYSAKCSSCGKQCEVPFEPINGKPVKCKDCYKKKEQKFGRFKKRMFDATCSKCNKECKVPFKPNGKKPVLCKDCYMDEKNNQN